MVASAPALAQNIAPRPSSNEEAVAIERVMGAITPAAMQVGQESDFFLRLADQIRLTDEQHAKIVLMVVEETDTR